MRTRGFTLVEVMVTLAIVGMLASVAIPLGKMAVQRGKELELKQALREIRGGIDAYKRAGEQGRIEIAADASGYPPGLDVLVDGVANAQDPNKAKIYFLRRLPRDPFYPDSSAPAVQSWGVRSYASPPEDPQAGDDVFDVYTYTKGVGLNGVPYREW